MRHIVSELGHTITAVPGGLQASATVFPELCAPGTSRLRTSVLAMWTDAFAGMVALDVLAPRRPVTLDLAVDLSVPAPVDGSLRASARVIRHGRSVLVAGVDFTDDGGEPFAHATAAFVSVPGAPAPPGTTPGAGVAPGPGQRLAVPLAERVGCARRRPGMAVMNVPEDGLNASRAVNGGLLSVAAEEAVLSLAGGATLCSLGLRYLEPVRVGPLVATARDRHELSVVELRDAGELDRLCAIATARTFVAQDQ